MAPSQAVDARGHHLPGGAVGGEGADRGAVGRGVAPAGGGPVARTPPPPQEAAVAAPRSNYANTNCNGMQMSGTSSFPSKRLGPGASPGAAAPRQHAQPVTPAARASSTSCCGRCSWAAPWRLARGRTSALTGSCSGGQPRSPRGGAPLLQESGGRSAPPPPA